MSDYPFAPATLLSFARKPAGAATIPELSVHTRFPYVNIASPTLRWCSDTADPGEELGNLSDRYRILHKLCIAAEAELFLGQQLYNHELVVLKIYHEGIAPETAVLERVRVISQFSSEHLVRLHEHGWNAGRYYEVQEYLTGKTLNFLVGNHSIPLADAKIILQQLSSALRCLHSQDIDRRLIVHRDIKPANVLIRDLATLDLVLCDFGISALTGGEGSPDCVRRDCTPCYASPETFSGIITPKADYWSLGIILLEALLGRHLLKETPPGQIENMHREGWRPDICLVSSPEWRELLTGLTHPNHEERWGYEEVNNWLYPDAQPETGQAAGTAAAPEEEYIEEFNYLYATTLNNFVIKLLENWTRVSPLLDDEIFLRFMTGTLNSLAPDQHLDDLLDRSGHRDIRLLKLIYRLAPAFPYFWKGVSIQRQHLAEICFSVVAGDNEHQRLVEELFELQVLQALAAVVYDDEMECRADNWCTAVDDYLQITHLMLRGGAPTEMFPERPLALAKLYLMACEEEENIDSFTGEISHELIFFFPWLQHLQEDGDSASPGKRLLRTIFIPVCSERNKENFKVSHPDPINAVRVEARQVRAMGWRWPTVAMSAVHIDYEMYIYGKKMTIAKGVMLRWDVRGALFSYLTGFGFVAASGKRPDERTSCLTAFKVLDNCGCENHNSTWFTISETTTFTLTAIGPTGFSVHRLPPIVVPQPVLEPQIELAAVMSELLPQEVLSVPVPELPPQLQLLPSISLSVAAMGAHDFSVCAMNRADLIPRVELSVQPLGQADLQQPLCFSGKSDDQLRFAHEHGLLRKRRFLK